jgi:hypothetical protein
MRKFCYNRAVGTVNPGLHLIAERSDVTALQEESYREIPVVGPKGSYVAFVDASKYEEISQFTWKPFVDRAGNIYAIRYIHTDDKKNQNGIFMHRQVLGLHHCDRGIKVFHVDSSARMDNRLSNLYTGSQKDVKHRTSGIVPLETGICPVCDAHFKTYPSRLKDGRGKFCSKKCADKAKTVRPPKFVQGPAICEGCNIVYFKKRENMRFCSEKCQKKIGGLRFETNGGTLTRHMTGEVAEHQVIIDLIRKGYWVFKPIGFGCGFDYLAIRGEEIEKVEVKAGRMQNKTGYISVNRPGGSRGPAVHTLLAVVIGDKIIYERREKKEEKTA